VERTVAEVSASSRQDGGGSKLDCFIRFDKVNYWQSRTRELIANAETHSYRAFLESFGELRRESRKAEFELVVALYHFQQEMEPKATDGDNQ
jgi:hypothetical protein